MNNTNLKKGIIFILISAFGFATMSLFVKLAGDLPTAQKSFFRNFVAAVFALTMLIKNKEFKFEKLEKEAWKTLILRATFGTLGILCNFYAVDHLFLSDAVTLNQLSPFFVIIFSFLFLKEKISIKQIAIIIIAFLGALFVIKPSFANLNLGAIVGFSGSIFAGLAYTMVRKLGKFNINSSFVVFFFSMFSCLFVTPSFIMNFVPMTTWQISCLLLAGLAASAGQFGVTLAYFNAPAKSISIYNYSQIIFSAVYGLLFFNQLPDIYSFFGYVIIFSMAITMYIYNRKNS